MRSQKVDSMRKPLCLALIMLGILLIFVQGAVAAATSLTWSQNTDPSVVGYKIYYRSDTPSLPFDGSGASEGVSPIDVGDVTSTTVSGLPENGIHYFTLTAYNAAGYESAFSNIVASGWIPPLLTPTDGSSAADPNHETFNWETAPTSYNVTYTLYYGTDQQLTSVSLPQIPQSLNPNLQIGLIAILVVLLGFMLISGNRPRRTLIAGALTLTLGLSLAGCGGGGGTTGSDGGVPLPGSSSTVVVPTGTANYHDAFDLKPATTYYWKVVATDQTNPGIQYESLTFNFTTSAN